MSVSIAIVLILIAYATGVVRFRRHARRRHQPPMMRMLAIGAALLLIELALASPLDELADQLLSAHMVQHLLLMLAAAPLLVWARPLPYFVWSPPMPVRKGIAYLWNRAGISRLVRPLETPAVSWIAFCSTVLLWHVPAIYRWAVGGELRHSLMHLSFLGSALLFWSVVLDPDDKRRLSHCACALFVLSAALVTGLPGALICFARQALYMLTPNDSIHDGLTVLADQQLAGLIMWIPMDLFLFGVAMALFAAALRTAPAEGRGESVNGSALHAFFNAHSDQSPVYGITRDETRNDRLLHRGPEFDAIDRRLTTEVTWENDQLQQRHHAVHGELPRGQR